MMRQDDNDCSEGGSEPARGGPTCAQSDRRVVSRLPTRAGRASERERGMEKMGEAVGAAADGDWRV